MLQGVFLALGAAAFILMISTAFLDLADDTRIIFSVLSMVLWFVWSIQATEVTKVGPNGTVTESYTSLLLIGLVLGGIMALSFVMQAINLFEKSQSLT